MADEKEELVEEELDLSLDDIEFKDMTLSEWQDYLTIKIPNLPCSSMLITQTIIELNNKYQQSFNCYNELLVLTSKVESTFKKHMDKAVSKKIEEFTSKGVTKTPVIDKLELLVLSSDDKAKELYDLKELYTVIRDFFQNNKNKLEKVLQSIKDISFSINSSEKLYLNGKDNHGL